MKNRLFVSLVLLGLFGLGCSPTKPTPVAPAAIPSTEATGLAMKTESYEEEAKVKGVVRCHYSFEMPIITGGMNQQAMQKANLEIATAFGVTSTTPQQQAKAFLDECKQDFEGMTEDDLADYPPGVAYEYTTTHSSQTVGEAPGVLSIAIGQYTYMAGAHGNPDTRALNIDLATGNKLVLGDLIKASSLQALMKNVRSQVLNEYDDALFEEPREEFQAFVNNPNPLLPSEQESLASIEDFQLTSQRFYFFWNVYDIAPYAAGLISVTVPYTDAAEYLRTDSPLKLPSISP